MIIRIIKLFNILTILSICCLILGREMVGR